MIFGLLPVHLLLPDRAVSRTERRTLAQKPALSSSFPEDLEAYLLDQFPFREQLRTVNTAVRFYALAQLDHQGVYLYEGEAYQREDPLDEAQVRYAGETLCRVRDTWFPQARVFYAVAPDKNALAETGRPKRDDRRLLELFREAVTGMEEIELWDTLSREDYYRTDPHWRQERIYPAAQRLAEGLGVTLVPFESYTAHALSPFYGAYYGQAALPLEADTLIYLTNELTEAATVTGPELDGAVPLYRPELLDGMDGYDVYLSGAKSVLTVSCPSVGNGKRLILFRDSFGSSIAPYFLGAYEEIVLVDLRYISASALGDYVDFSGADVLVLLSSSVLNHGGILRR